MLEKNIISNTQNLLRELPFNKITIIEITYYFRYLDRYDVLIGTRLRRLHFKHKNLEILHSMREKDYINCFSVFETFSITNLCRYNCILSFFQVKFDDTVQG